MDVLGLGQQFSTLWLHVGVTWVALKPQYIFYILILLHRLRSELFDFLETFILKNNMIQ